MEISRLKKRSDFLRASRTNIVAKTSSMLVQCFATDQLQQPFFLRVGFTASRRVGNAVKRNKAKRRLKALVNNHLKDQLSEIVTLNPLANIDFVFIALPSTANAKFQNLFKDFIKGIQWCLPQLQQQLLLFQLREETSNVAFDC